MFRRIFTALCALILLMSANSAALAVTPDDWSMEHPEIFEAGHLFSEAAILIDADSGEVLFDGMSAHYAKWKQKAEADVEWASENPIQVIVTQNAEKRLSAAFLPEI